MTRHSSTLAMPRGRTKPIRTAITRSGSMMSETRTDHYGYNDRSELVSGTKDTAATNLTEYAYQYDDIGNRLLSFDLGTNRTYTANTLNQYTSITGSVGDPPAQTEDFTPAFDLDGNQTLIKTSTGVWQVSYNAENRPVLWECGSTNITMKFDRMGRRVEYVETVSGVTNTHHRFVYDGYLCIQRLNAASNNSIDLVFGWDPSEQVATRPLILQKYGAYSLFYTHDGNKNVSELVFFQQANGIAAHYEYAPFGAVTVTSKSTPVTDYDFREYNPFRFSSEYADDKLGLVYYNYRHYEPMMGRWLSRDPIEEIGGIGQYLWCNNYFYDLDALGTLTFGELLSIGGAITSFAKRHSALTKWLGISGILFSLGDCVVKAANASKGTPTCVKDDFEAGYVVKGCIDNTRSAFGSCTSVVSQLAGLLSGGAVGRAVGAFLGPLLNQLMDWFDLDSLFEWNCPRPKVDPCCNCAEKSQGV